MPSSKSAHLVVEKIPSPERRKAFIKHFADEFALEEVVSGRTDHTRACLQFSEHTKVTRIEGAESLFPSRTATYCVLPMRWPAPGTEDSKFGAVVLDVEQSLADPHPNSVNMRKAVTAQATKVVESDDWQITLSSTRKQSNPSTSFTSGGWERVDVADGYSYLLRIPVDNPSEQASAFDISISGVSPADAFSIQESITSIIPCRATRRNSKISFYHDPTTTVYKQGENVGDIEAGHSLRFISSSANPQFKIPLRTVGSVIALRPPEFEGDKSEMTVLSDATLILPDPESPDGANGRATITHKTGHIKFQLSGVEKSRSGYVIPMSTAQTVSTVTPTTFATQMNSDTDTAAGTFPDMSPGQEMGTVLGYLGDLLRQPGGSST